MKRNTRGQVTLEVAILFTAIAASLVFMMLYLQRGVQGGVKSSADSFGTQFSGNQPWTQVSASATAEGNVSATATGTAQLRQINQAGTGAVDVSGRNVPVTAATPTTAEAKGPGKVVSVQKTAFDQRLCAELIDNNLTRTFDCPKP